MRCFFNLVISSQAELSPGGSFGQQAQLTAGYGLTRPALRDFFMTIFFFSARLGIVPSEKHRQRRGVRMQLEALETPGKGWMRDSWLVTFWLREQVTQLLSRGSNGREGSVFQQWELQCKAWRVLNPLLLLWERDADPRVWSQPESEMLRQEWGIKPRDANPRARY